METYCHRQKFVVYTVINRIDAISLLKTLQRSALKVKKTSKAFASFVFSFCFSFQWRRTAATGRNDEWSKCSSSTDTEIVYVELGRIAYTNKSNSCYIAALIDIE